MRRLLALLLATLLLAACADRQEVVETSASTEARPPTEGGVSDQPGAVETTAAGVHPTVERPPSVTLPVPGMTATTATTQPVASVPEPTSPEPEEPPAAAEPPAPAEPGGPDALLRTPLGCADGPDAAALDRFFAERCGPVLGWDYPHVTVLDAGRALWLFQDVFVEYDPGRSSLAAADLLPNVAVLQEGLCFTLVHRGTEDVPAAFEPGAGTRRTSRWWWPLGGAVDGAVVRVFWAEMAFDEDFPPQGAGLPWFPVGTWLATYGVDTLERVGFGPAPDPGVQPLFGFAVVSDGSHSYLFGNSYDQDLAREGGFAATHSATSNYLARVPIGGLDQAPEYWDGTAWSPARASAVPVSQRFQIENPLQPQLLDGQWLATTKVDGFYGDLVMLDAAAVPQGPWIEVGGVTAPSRPNHDPVATYHAYPLPWLGPAGELLVIVSQNAADAVWAPAPHGADYRPLVIALERPQLPPGAGQSP